MINLKANKRKILGKGVRTLKKNNLIPAVVYGHNFEPQNITVNKNDFKGVFAEAGQNTIINLEIDGGGNYKALIHDVQLDPIKNEIIHVDFYCIKEKEKVTVEVAIKFIGEAPVVKERGGILIHHLSMVKIEALPKDLIHEIEADISNLKEFNDLIRIKDIKFPSTIKVLHDPEDVVVSISQIHQEEKKSAIDGGIETEIKEEEEKEKKTQGQAEKEEEK